MNLYITLRVALRALMRNKIRSALTMLGIIIGIAAVIAVIAVGQGATLMIQTEIRGMGDNLMMIFPGSASTRGFHWGTGTRTTLTPDDGEAILKECPTVKGISPVVNTHRQLIYKENNWFARIEGVGISYPEIRNWEIEQGNFFAESDIRSAKRVCVLGMTVAENLFKDEDPIGKTMRIRNMPFRILGVLVRKGAAFGGWDQDNIVIAPWTTVKRVIQGSAFNNVNYFLSSIISIEAMPEANREITALLRQRHKIPPGMEDDFTIRDMAEITEIITQTSRMMTLLLTIIASISLIVGGIGIMNIMLVSVTERTREIGLRMAVGARGKDIMLQFLVEAIVLSTIGGAFGIILGAGAAEIISHTNHWPTLVSINSIMLAVIFAGGIGIFFGSYPAWRASHLDPITALRYE